MDRLTNERLAELDAKAKADRTSRISWSSETVAKLTDELMERRTPNAVPQP